jgi:hypothetical protein
VTTTRNLLILNSILAVIYLTKLQNLINRPVMNCSMSIFPYFYFSDNILFDFPSSGLIFINTKYIIKLHAKFRKIRMKKLNKIKQNRTK